jgi:WD40 repeat protein
MGNQDEGYELYTFKPDGSDLSLYQEGIGAADWLADNKYVVYSLLNDVYLLDIGTNKQVLLYDGDEETSFVSLHVSPDQNHILLVQGSGNFSQTIWLMTIGMQ